MPWTDVTITAGLLLGLVGCVLVVYHARRRWWPSGRIRDSSLSRIESIAELASQSACFGGIAIVQFGNVAEHLSEGTIPVHLWPSVVSIAAGFLLFGISLGRLHVRWQLRLLRAVLDTESGKLMPRS